jgi:hypothetical protein
VERLERQVLHHEDVREIDAVARQDQDFARFLDQWIDLKRLERKYGTIQTLYDHWILGREAVPLRPRWSIIRNVLHWVD